MKISAVISEKIEGARVGLSLASEFGKIGFMDPQEQAAHTPWTVLFSGEARRKIPVIRTVQLELDDHSTSTIEELMSEAVSAWGTLSDSERQDWQTAGAALPKPMIGFSYFVWQYLVTGAEPEIPSEPRAEPQEYYFQNDGGKICLTRYTPRPDPNSDAQQEYRGRFRDALDTWSILTNEEKDYWNRHPEALAESLPGRSVFIRHFIREPF